ncbi:MAG: hypothetical protein Ta2B_27450 [Termitinemataceae bacterium]|nr:MAG: hypothetical protein Ta2B_27450 [Termitinemataceae bacterium]
MRKYIRHIICTVCLLFLIKIGANAANANFALGYEFGNSHNLESGLVEKSHNFMFDIRYLWFDNIKFGFVFSGSFGGLDDFEWDGITFSDDDGSLLVFGGLIGVSFSFVLSDGFRIVMDCGVSIDSKSLNKSTYVGEQTYPYSYYDTLHLALVDNRMGVAGNIALQFYFTEKFYADLGLRVHYDMTQNYTGSSTFEDQRHPLSSKYIPKEDLKITSYQGTSSPVKILNLCPHISIGFSL